MKSKLRYPLKRVMRIPDSGRTIPKSCIHGIHYEETIGTVGLYLSTISASYSLRPIASLTMYQRARKIHSLLTNNPGLLPTLASLELDAYMIASNALSLVDPKNAWVLIPAIDNQNVPVGMASISLLQKLIGLSSSRSQGNSLSIFPRTDIRLENTTPN